MKSNQSVCERTLGEFPVDAGSLRVISIRVTPRKPQSKAEVLNVPPAFLWA
jgi:hypothetical protein